MSNVSAIGSNETIDEAVGRRIHALMWQQRIKNKDLAVLLDLEPTGISKKLRGSSKFSIEQLVDAARALNTTVAYLVGETENPHPGKPGGGSSSHLGDSNPRPIHYE